MSNVFYIKKEKEVLKKPILIIKGRLIFQTLKGLEEHLKGIQISITNLL